MDTLRIRVYNVRFGDAILVTVPDRGRNRRVMKRHLLIDVGNVLSGHGGGDEVFLPVLKDILEVTGGQPVDLYVMTHEHMDHVQGLLAGSRLGVDVKADYAWLTASAAEDYYDTHPEARRKLQLAMRFYDAIERRLAAAPEAERAAMMARMLNNNYRRTADCVAHLRNIAPAGRVHYVHREYPLANAHPFQEARFEIWAPEEDTASYYGRFQPMTFGFRDGAGGARDGNSASPEPPHGVDVGAFYNLLERREAGVFDNLLAIDKARNNSSVVFLLEWRGWRLLFSGDAELRSWSTMQKHGVLAPVHVLKVSHHGSHNGTPSGEMLDAILPPEPPDGEDRFAIISTCRDTYSGVPHEPTTSELTRRCDVLTTEGMVDGEWWDLELSA